MVVARDGLTLGELPVGSRVGTGSPRRAAQLHALGLGVEVVGVRGNVDTRIAKVRSGEYDAVVLARAGLARIGRLDEVTEVLDPLQMLPAPGQGALAVECRTDDDLAAQLREVLDDPRTRAAVEAERAVLATLEGGCSAPIGALADVVEGEDGEELWVRAIALSPDGGLSVRMSATGDPADAAGVGDRLAKEMLADGAADLTHTNERLARQGAERMTRAKTSPNQSQPRGWVSFVGSGPGDPGLLTVRAVELLRRADVVVTEVPEHAELIRQVLGLPVPAEDDAGAGRPRDRRRRLRRGRPAADPRRARQGRRQARQDAACASSG